MKRTLLLAFLSVCFAIIISAGTAWAVEGTVESGECGAEGDNVVWTLENGTLTISGKGAMADYKAGSGSKPPWDSMSSSINSVVIEDGVTSIGDYAFWYYMGLSSVSIADSVTSIGVEAFWTTNLTMLTIPDSVTDIKKGAFSACKWLSEVAFPQSSLTIGEEAFSACHSLETVYLPEGVTSIKDGAFWECMNLPSVSIPSTVTEIGDAVFWECNDLSSITVDSKNTAYAAIDDVLFNKELTELLCYAASKADTAYTIPSSVTKIRSTAFSNADNLTELTVPVSVSEIQYIPLDSCLNLKDIYYEGTPAQWNQIKFEDSEWLKELTIHYGKDDETISLINGTKYVPYSVRLSFEGAEDAGYEVAAGVLPTGVVVKTDGEIYGVPRSAGTFTFTVRAALDRYTATYDERVLTLDILENTDENVAAATERGYEVIQFIGSYLDTFYSRIFQSAGPFDDFVDLWLDGKKLTKGTDYEVSMSDGTNDYDVKGSTIITISRQTIRENDDGKGTTHTIAAEFRSGEPPASYTAQNYKVDNPNLLPIGVKYVPYSHTVEAIDGYQKDDPEIRFDFEVESEDLPRGLVMNRQTGEISGVPLEFGTFNFGIICEIHSASDDEVLTGGIGLFTLYIEDNTNTAVQKPNDYPITDPVGTPDPNDPNHFYKSDYRTEVLRIDGPYYEFMRLLIDGKEKRRDIDYEAHEGSTVITIYGETFEDVGSGTHTIAAEFRENGDPDGTLKTVAQNYTIQLPTTPSYPSYPGSSGGSTSTPKPDPKPETKPDPVPTVMPKPDVTQSNAFPFTDVTPPDWFYDDVKWAYEEEIMTGETSTRFAPANAISQATVVTVLARMAEVDLTQFDGITAQDVEPGQWYTNAAIWAKQTGMLPDYSTFTGTGPFSRAQMAVMLVKYLRSLGFDASMPEVPVAFADSDLMSEEENTAFQMLYRCGIFKGVGDLYMDPGGTTERAQFAALVHRISIFVETN